MSSEAQKLIAREVDSRREVKIVTVIGDLRMFEMSPGDTAPVWVTDVEFGKGKPMRNVPVKAINGVRFYAQRGQTVQIKRNTFGRWQIIGPGDRLATTEITKEYDLGTGNQVGQDQNRGFSFLVQPFEFYLGPKAMKGNPALTFANTGGNDTLTRAAGSWTDDNFEVGDAVSIQGTAANGKPPGSPITIAAISGGGTVLEFAGDPFVDEGPLSNLGVIVPGTAFWNNGSSAIGFPEVTLVDGDGNPA